MEGVGTKERARRLRREQTVPEKMLWEVLRRERLGVKFRRQHPVGPYFADFACVEKGLVIELDGTQHATDNARAYDAERTAYLNAAGFQVLRFWNTQVLNDLRGTIQHIQIHLK